MASVRACLAQLRLIDYADRLDELGYDDLFYLAKVMTREQRMRVGLDQASMKAGHASKFADKLPEVAEALFSLA